jgi:hypothetical protein
LGDYKRIIFSPKYVLNHGVPQFSSTGHSKPRFRSSECKNVLTVEGFAFEEVDFWTERKPELNEYFKHLQADWKDWCEQYRERGQNPYGSLAYQRAAFRETRGFGPEDGMEKEETTSVSCDANPVLWTGLGKTLFSVRLLKKQAGLQIVC